MFALDEKVRTVVLLSPGLLMAGKDQDIISKFEENYLEVKAAKQIYLSTENAGRFMLALPQDRRAPAASEWSKGLTQVLILEHLDGDVIERTVELVGQLALEYGEECLYCSANKWFVLRDMEFFFPHLDDTPVERTLMLVKPDGVVKGSIGGQTLEESIEFAVANAGLFIVAKQKQMLMSNEAEVICADLKETPDFAGAVRVACNEPGVVAMCIEGHGAVGKCLLLAGPTNAGMAKDLAPTTLRALWGTDGTSNAVHASLTVDAAEAELTSLFPQGKLTLQRTLCIVTPSAMEHVLQIRLRIQEAGFTILKEKHTEITKERAMEFHRDSKTGAELQDFVDEVCSGTCALMVLCRLEAVAVWNQLKSSMAAGFGKPGCSVVVHASASLKRATWEIRLFFPELGVDPMPEADEVRDYLFRKAAGSAMDLKTLTSANTTDYTVDPTMQQLISNGLLALCQVRPKGLAAIEWFKDWLQQNNPNKKCADQSKDFEPPERTKTGATQDCSEAFSATESLRVVEVPTEAQKLTVDFPLPPHVVCVVANPRANIAGHCSKLSEEFKMVHLDVVAMMQDEVSAGTRMGLEISKALAKDSVPTELAVDMLKEAMLKHVDTNRFLISGFPATLDHARLFEHEVASISFILSMQGDTSDHTLPVDTQQVADYFGPIGKLRTVNLDLEEAEAYEQSRSNFKARFIYLSGPPGAPTAKVALHLQAFYGFSAIDFPSLLQTYADSDEADAQKVKQALLKGKPLEASIACPLLLAEIYRDMAVGVQNFVICDFPQTLKQAEFLEFRVPCTSQPILLDFTRADADDLAVTLGQGYQTEVRTADFFSANMQDVRNGLSGLVRLPCKLAEMDMLAHGTGPSTAEGLEKQLVDILCEKVRKQIMPSVTLILGMPHCGSDVLARMLAKTIPNSQAVKCSQLLVKEVERKTDIGVSMQAMLVKNQAVPFATTVDILKGLVNLTCSEHLIIEQCPMESEMIDELCKAFNIQKVYYITGDSEAVSTMEQHFKKVRVESGASQDDARQDLQDIQTGLRLMVDHFNWMGKLDKLVVPAVLSMAREADVEAAFDDALKLFEEPVEEEAVEEVKPPAEEGEEAEEAEEEDGEKKVEPVKAKPLPRVYAVVAPSGSGRFDIASLATTAICNSATDGTKPAKMAVLDAMELFQPGKYSPELEEALHRASFSATAPDDLPMKLWVDLFSEAFAASSNPLGPFLIKNFPTPSAMAEGPKARDQFSWLSSISNLSGILHIHLSEKTFSKCCSDDPADASDYQRYDAEVHDQMLKQYGKSLICECFVDADSPEAVTETACAGFLKYMAQEIEQSRCP